MFFLRKGRRAQRAENFDAISYTLKKYIRLLRSELETKSYTLKTVYGNYELGHTIINFTLNEFIHLTALHNFCHMNLLRQNGPATAAI